MKTTFILAQKLGVSPFEIMAQDIDAVIMVVNYLVDSSAESNAEKDSHNTFNEKEQDKAFWAAL